MKPADQPTDGRTMGLAAHKVIGELYAGGNWGSDVILQTAGASAAALDAGSYRAAARHRLATLAGVYRHFFLPSRARLIAVELAVPGARLDLVLQNVDTGERWSDELKSNHHPGRNFHQQVDDQVTRQTLGGSQALPDFAGVRVCVLTAPLRSFFRRPTGANLSLADRSIAELLA